jgi:hypothetical protein
VGTSVLVLYEHDWAPRCWSYMGICDCCDPSSAGTLTRVKSLKNVC